MHENFQQLSEAHRDALSVALGLSDGPPSDRLVVSTAVLMLLREAAAERPVLVIVDDLPWMDRASLVVLGSVARHLAGSRIGFLAASRSGQESFLDSTGLASHEVLPLDEPAADRLVGDRFPVLAPEVRQRLLSEAQGNPLALLELATTLSDPQRAAHRLVAGAIQTWAAVDDTDDALLMEAVQTLLFVCLWALRLDLWESLHAALARFAPRIPATLYLEVQTIADPVRTAAPALAQLDAAIAGLRDETDVVRIDRLTRAATYVDRIPDCRETLWRIIRDGREGGAVTAAIFSMLNMCVDDFFTGRWDESGQLADEGLTLCRRHGYQLLAWPFRLGVALIAAGRGDDDRTRALTDEMMRWAVPRRIRGVEIFAWHARSLAALGQGDFEAAYQNAAAISPAGTLASHVAYALRVPMDLVEAAVRTGRHVAGDRQVEGGDLVGGRREGTGEETVASAHSRTDIRSRGTTADVRLMCPVSVPPGHGSSVR